MASDINQKERKGMKDKLRSSLLGTKVPKN